MRRFILVGLVLAIACVSAQATTYYVATNGNDSWPGTEAEPWLTLQHAVDTIANGDTIIVKNGTYRGCRIENSGASGAPKTLKAQNYMGAVLNQKGVNCAHNSVLEIENQSYWVIENFRVNGMSSYTYGIDVRVCNNITVRKNDVHSAALTGIMTAHSYYSLVENNEVHENGEHGTYMADSSDYGTQRGNYSWSNTRCGYHHNGGLPDGGDGQMSYWLDEKNIATGNPGAAFNYDGVSDSKMINNLAYKNSHLGFALYCIDGAEGSRRNLVYNNTVYFTTAGYDCVSISNYGSPAIDNKIKNNILIQERTGYSSICGYSSSMGSGFQSDYNIVVDRFSIDDGNTIISLAAWRTYGYDTHSQISNASTEFVDAANNDYHLKAGAKAINGGTTLSEVADDMDGVTRPQGGAYDCGCYESTGGVPDLVITTTSLPSGRVGTAYSQTLQATGGVTPYTWSVVSGSLPAGLSLGSSTGTISGTPTAAGTSNFTARVTDSQAPADTDDQALSITIYADLNVTTTSLPDGRVGTAYSQTLQATGGKTPYTWSIVSGSLPAGLSLGSSTGTISGTPTAAGTSNFTARVTDSQSPADTDDQALSITIYADLNITTTSLPDGRVGTAYSQTLQATGGKTPYTWSIVSGSLPAGLSLGSSTGTISGTPTAAGTSNFTARVTDSQSPADTDDQALSIIIYADLVITTTSLPAGIVGIAYSQPLAATGGKTPYSWSLDSGSLPAGLSLSSGGVISGTPTTAGTSNFTVKVTDSQSPADTATKALSIVINASVPPLVITTTSLPDGQLGVAYSQTLAATGGVTPYSWSIVSGSLPAGLSLGSSTGTISGTPTASGTSNFTVRVTDSQTPTPATDDQALSIAIPAELVITTTSLPNGTVGAAYSQTLAATGGKTPYSWSVVSGSLPAGLSLGSSTGTISGTPTAAGTSNFTVRVTDSQAPADTDDQALSIVIVAGSASTYEFAANDTEASTTSTAWQTRTTLTFTPSAADDWIILGFAEFKGSSASYSAKLRLVVDGTTEAEITKEPKDTTDYVTFQAAKLRNLAASSHTLTLDYCSENASATTYVRRARVVALRKAGLSIYSASAESTQALTTTLTDYVTLNLAPSTGNDYLVIYSAETSANTSYSTQVQAKYDGTIYDDCLVESKDNTDYVSWMNFSMFWADSAGHTAKITAAKETGSTATHNIRKARIIVLQLTGGRFNNYNGRASDSLSTTTSTSFVEKMSCAWTAGNNGNWLLIATGRVSGSSTSYSTEVRLQLNDSTALVQQLAEPQDTTDFMQYGCVDMRSLTTPRDVDTDYRTENASATAGIKYARFYCLPLDD